MIDLLQVDVRTLIYRQLREIAEQGSEAIQHMFQSFLIPEWILIGIVVVVVVIGALKTRNIE